MVEVFVREIVRQHSLPHSIVSDRDCIFMSRFWAELLKVKGTDLKYNTTYHLQIEGQKRWGTIVQKHSAESMAAMDRVLV